MTDVLNIEIVDDVTGVVLADVDGNSTIDGLAYFLRSRGWEDDITTETLAMRVQRSSLGVVASTGKMAAEVRARETVVWEERNPITHGLVRAVFARVKGTE